MVCGFSQTRQHVLFYFYLDGMLCLSATVWLSPSLINTTGYPLKKKILYCFIVIRDWPCGKGYVTLCTTVDHIHAYIYITAVFVGPCHHGMARPQVADGGTASEMEGSCE